MRTRRAAVVTWDEIRTYFTGPVWKESNWFGGKFTGETRNFSVEVEPEEVLFEYRIEAVDDPSDSEEGVTADPAAKIAKFLGRDIPGGEFFERRAAARQVLARALRAAADGLLLGRPDRRRTCAVLRRIALLHALPQAVPVIRQAAARLAGMADDAFDELESRLESKEWKVEREEDESGSPRLKVDVSGIYEATISVDSILYSYEFQLRDHPELTKSGTTKDPIEEFRRFYRSEEVREAESDLEPARAPTEPSPESVRETAPAGPRSDVQERTVPARRPA